MSKYASKPESVTVLQNISGMGHLNRYDAIQDNRYFFGESASSFVENPKSINYCS